MRRALLLFAVIAGLTAPAYGGALIAPDYWRYQNWMDHAAVPAPPGRITFRLEPCPWTPTTRTASCVIDYGDDKPDELYLDPAQTDQRRTFLHEVGHVFDHQVLIGAFRRAFERLAGRPRGWAAGIPPTLELFAAAYSDCATGDHNGQYGWNPSPAVHAAVCALIRAAGRRRWATLPQPDLTQPSTDPRRSP